METIDLLASKLCRAQSLTFEGLVGRGAFKAVYKATAEDGTQLALKILTSPTSSARTPREIEAIQRCDHPSIGSIRSIGKDTFEGNSYDYIIEEFLAGGTLTDRLSGDPMSAEAAVELGLHLTDALAHLEQRDLVHRDIKPDNIMFAAASSVPILVDFGLVRDLRATSLTGTWLPHGPGTPYFASPEQLRNEKNLIDWRADQFSLGVTLSLAVLGFHPYQHSDEPPGAPFTVDRVANRGSRRPDFEEAAKSMGLTPLTKMTSPWPIGRFRRPDELLSSLRALRD